MGNPNIPLWKFVFDIIQTSFTVGISIYEEETGLIKNRLTALETKIEHLPNREAIGNIHRRLDDQAKTLHKMEGALNGVNDTSKLILETLLTKGDKP